MKAVVDELSDGTLVLTLSSEGREDDLSFIDSAFDDDDPDKERQRKLLEMIAEKINEEKEEVCDEQHNG